MLDETTRDAILKVRDEAAEKGIDALFTMHREKSHLMRIGNNSVSLNTSEDLTRLDVEVINGRREGSYTIMGDITGPESVRKALDVAVEKASVSTPKDYDPISRMVEENAEEMLQYDEALETLDPGEKAVVYREVIEKTGSHLNFSGSWSSGSTEVLLASTKNDNLAWRIGTDQQFTCVLKHPEKKWELASFQTGWQAGEVKAESTIESFNWLLPIYGNPGFRVEPGEYTVLFGSQAVAEIVGMAIGTGMSGRGYEEGMNWTCGRKPGDSILSDKITVIDDPTDMNTFRFGFDMAGMTRNVFPIVEKGRMMNLFYDLATAAKYGKKPTPHSGSASVVVSPGDGPECPMEAVRGMGRVLFIPALHYTHIPNRSKGIFTGSSRFSAVLLENGEMVSPIFSSRITDTFQNVLGNVAVLAPWCTSVNGSSTYDRRMPEAASVPGYMVSTGVKITDSAESF